MAIPMTWDIPQNPDDVRPEDFTPVPPGFYHVVVKEVDSSKLAGPSPHLIIRFAVLAGPHKGRTVRESFFTSDKAQRRVQWLAVVCGLIRQGGRQTADMEQLKGKTLIINTIVEKYDDNGEEKLKAKLLFDGMYKLDDPKVPADVPRGEDGPASPFAGSPPPAPPPRPAAATAVPPRPTPHTPGGSATATAAPATGGRRFGGL